MAEPALPDNVRRMPDGGLWVAQPRAHRGIELAVTVVAVVAGLLFLALGGGLFLLVGADGPGPQFLLVGGLVVVVALVLARRARRGHREDGWELGRAGLTRRDQRASTHVGWDEVASLVLWDRRTRPRPGLGARPGPWVRLVSVLVLDREGREQLELPAENSDRRLRAVFGVARRLGLVPDHVVFEERHGHR